MIMTVLQFMTQPIAPRAESSPTFRRELDQLHVLMLTALVVPDSTCPVMLDARHPADCQPFRGVITEVMTRCFVEGRSCSTLSAYDLMAFMLCCHGLRLGRHIVVTADDTDVDPNIVRAPESPEMHAMLKKILEEIDPSQWTHPKTPITRRVEKWSVAANKGVAAWMQSVVLEWPEFPPGNPLEQAQGVSYVLHAHSSSVLMTTMCAHMVALWPWMPLLLRANLTTVVVGVKSQLLLLRANMTMGKPQSHAVELTMLPWSAAALEARALDLPLYLQPLATQAQQGLVTLHTCRSGSEIHDKLRVVYAGLGAPGKLLHQLICFGWIQAQQHRAVGSGDAGSVGAYLETLDVSLLLGTMLQRGASTEQLMPMCILASAAQHPLLTQVRDAYGIPTREILKDDMLTVMQQVRVPDPESTLAMAIQGWTCSGVETARAVLAGAPIDPQWLGMHLDGVLRGLPRVSPAPGDDPLAVCERMRLCLVDPPPYTWEWIETVRQDCATLDRLGGAVLSPGQFLAAACVPGVLMEELMTKLIHSALVFAPLIVGDCIEGWRATLDTPRRNMQSLYGPIAAQASKKHPKEWSEIRDKYVRGGRCCAVSYSTRVVRDSPIRDMLEHVWGLLENDQTQSVVIGASSDATAILRASISTSRHGPRMIIKAQWAPQCSYRHQEGGTPLVCVTPDTGKGMYLMVRPKLIPGRPEGPVETAYSLVADFPVTQHLAAELDDSPGSMRRVTDRIRELARTGVPQRHQLDVIASNLELLASFLDAELPTECMPQFLAVVNSTRYDKRWPHDAQARIVTGRHTDPALTALSFSGGLVVQVTEHSPLVEMVSADEPMNLDEMFPDPDARQAWALIARIQSSPDLYALIVELRANGSAGMVATAYRMCEEWAVSEVTQGHLASMLVLAKLQHLPDASRCRFTPGMQRGRWFGPEDAIPLLSTLNDESCMAVMECHKCGKPLKNPSVDGYGPTCARKRARGGM